MLANIQVYRHLTFGLSRIFITRPANNIVRFGNFFSYSGYCLQKISVLHGIVTLNIRVLCMTICIETYYFTWYIPSYIYDSTSSFLWRVLFLVLGILTRLRSGWTERSHKNDLGSSLSILAHITWWIFNTSVSFYSNSAFKLRKSFINISLERDLRTI